ncbi:uncharacterized protein LOC121387369 isoform X2 [Gigantopelta aegis]|nr:uncharacterized protein LOC121387369 isoform X2 [Gigantopelta aegis]XP_041374375.1 uncharacterized protein LOC121387369 isoform X2 [Gigantopelta aegis]XP_041374376.1 uncharacterized protein LOC121387369 isoform X2 [Gigantopelta aegis]XP_041374377.1 uncharacterized protein LOC121387369 isoform X2 [Gigantopelta aegis]
MADQPGSGITEPGSVGLIDGQQNYRRNQPREPRPTACSGRLWMILTVVFLISTIAAVGVLLWREFGMQRQSKRDVLSLFPNFFRTPMEQKSYAEKVFKIEREEIVFTNKTVPSNDTCTFSCRYPRQQGMRKKRQASPGFTYHACCISETKFISPDSLENIFGISQTIVQFNDKKQFFQIQECSQVENCQGCNCAPSIQFVTAVVENEAASGDDDQYMLDTVKILGCCKCINGVFGRRKRSVLESIKFWTKWSAFVENKL